jgi:hypothetical protein
VSKPKDRKSNEFSRPFKITGQQGDTRIQGRMAVGPCKFVSGEAVALLSEITQSIYAAVAAARTINIDQGSKNYKHHQVNIATAALAASEAETIVTLTSVDLCATSRAHARALGEHARRISVFTHNPALAEEVFDSLDASRKHLAQQINAGHEARTIVDRLFENISGKTMEKIESERKLEFQTLDSYPQVITRYERKLWSKWFHGDVTAMAEVAERISNAHPNIKQHINVDNETEPMLLRCIGFALTVFAIFSTMQVEIQKPFDLFMERHRVINESVSAKVNASMERGRTLLAEYEAEQQSE